MSPDGKVLYSSEPPEIPAGDLSHGCRRLQGRRALVTAAARGIGFSTALRFASEGAQVWISDRDALALEQACDVAREAGIELRPVVMDSADSTSIKVGVQQVLAQAEGLDILCNNAGGSLHTPFRFLDASDSHWERVMTLNLMSTVWTSQAVLPAMLARGYGRIVNFGSKAGRYASLIAGANYAASKGAIASLTRQMAMEVGPHGVTVNCVCPGVVLTERTQRLWKERCSDAERQAVLEQIPLRRHCVPEEVAACVAFLVSDDASFISGITLDVNGGQAMA